MFKFFFNIAVIAWDSYNNTTLHLIAVSLTPKVWALRISSGTQTVNDPASCNWSRSALAARLGLTCISIVPLANQHPGSCGSCGCFSYHSMVFRAYTLWEWPGTKQNSQYQLVVVPLWGKTVLAMLDVFISVHGKEPLAAFYYLKHEYHIISSHACHEHWPNQSQ